MSEELVKLQPFLEKAHLLSPAEVSRISNKFLPFDAKLKLLREFLSLEDAPNPFEEFTFNSAEQAGTDFMRFLRNPDNFPYTCKLFFNIDLQPFQHVILKELWTKPFPMLIGARGLGKSFLLALYAMLRLFFNQGSKVAVVGAGFRQAKSIFEYMESFWYRGPIFRDIIANESSLGKDPGPHRSPDKWEMVIGNSVGMALPIGDGSRIRGQRANYLLADEFACLASSTLIQTDVGLVKISDYLKGNVYNLLNKNREFETPAKIFKTPLTDVYKVTTQNGYSFKCSNIHQVMTTNGWKLAKDLTKEDNLVLSSNDYFPSEYIIKDNIKLDENIGWLLGILVSEGTCTNRNFISIKNTDKELIEKIKNKYPFNWKENYKSAHIDPRGWNCRESWDIIYSDVNFRTTLRKFGLLMSVSYQKTIPSKILQSPKSVVVSFLSGLFEGDGTAFNYNEHNKKRVGIAYYSSSKKLIDTLQILLLKFGITCSVNVRYTKISNRKNYLLAIRGESAYKLYKLINVIKWKNKFDNADFLIKKPQIRSVTKKTTKYYLSTTEGNKNKYLGSFNSKEEAEKYFEIYSQSKDFVFRVKNVKKLKKQQHLYDFYMPKTNSFIGNGFVQHNSIPEEIFDTVIFGFASVSASPQEKVKEMAKVNLLKSMNLWTKENEKLFNKANRGNQVVLSGTADYTFGHFYKTYNLYKGVILSQNDPQKLKDVLGEKASGTGMKSEDCSIMRIPATLLPEGFMDSKIISAAKAKLDSSTYLKEYDATFPDDSSGFFKMSLIRSCECPVELQNGDNIMFDPLLRGTNNMKYVMAVDPASEKDKLAICILELHPNHRRIVYLWSIRRDEFKARLAKGVIKGEHDYFQYCALKIRELARDFNIVEIAIDQGGGGIAIEEALSRQPENPSELPFYRIKDPVDTKEPKRTDYLQGRHILNMISFSKAEWVSNANHALKLDMEQKTLIFPYHDMVSEEIAIQEDYQMGKVIIDKDNNNKEIRLYDSLTTVFEEIEELKNELVSIAHTKTPSNRERWDLPKHKGPDGKFITETKDRYSALLMANACGRLITALDSLPPPKEKKVFGGRVADFRGIVKEGQDFYLNAPDWMGKTSHLYGKVIKNKRSNY